MKTYYVTGRDIYGVMKTVKTEARNPAEARDNAAWVLVTPGTVHREKRG